MAQAMELSLGNPNKWTSRFPAGSGYVGRWSRNMNTANGSLEEDRGFKKHRQIATATNKAGLLGVHVHTDGNEYVWYYFNTALYPEDGSDSPTALATSLTETFLPSATLFQQPAALTMFVNGTNAQAYAIRKAKASSDLEAELMDLAAPGTTTVTPQTTGGSIADGTYKVRITWQDQDGATNVESEPSDVNTDATISGGGGSGSIDITRPGSPPARATHWRVYVSSTTDTPAAMTLEATVAVGTTTTTITSLTGTTNPANRNNVYQQAHMPLTGVTVNAEHLGRHIIAAANKIAWSVRDEPNHWYSTNTQTVGTGDITALASVGNVLYVFSRTQVHAVYGTFAVDSVGDNATYAHDVVPEPLDKGFGAVSKSVLVLGRNIFYVSTQGPARLRGGTSALVLPQDFKPEWDCRDKTKEDRCVVAEDPVTRHLCFGIPRQTNSSRPQDGASTAGIIDTIYRFNLELGAWAPPLALEATHFANQTNGTKASTGNATKFMVIGPHGHVLEMNFGWGGARTDGVFTSTDYDGVVASSSTTTSVTIPDLTTAPAVGETVTLFYPTDDTGFPAVIAQKTISSVSSAGGNTTINWQGALTAPSGTNWTIRVGGLVAFIDPSENVRQRLQIPPDEAVQLHGVLLRYKDIVGREAVA